LRQPFWHKNLAELTQQICLKSSQFLPTVLGVYNFLQWPSEENIIDVTQYPTLIVAIHQVMFDLSAF
jgi:hypothetical protein